MSHIMLQHLARKTSGFMTRKEMIADLMRHMQVGNLGRKKYVFLVVDDSSRFTWVNFIKEKSNTFNVFKDLCQTPPKREGGYNY